MGEASRDPLRLRLRPRVVALALAVLVLPLWTLGAIGALAEPGGGLGRLLDQFDFDREGNLAAFSQGVALLSLGVAAAVIAASAPRGRERMEWLGIAGVFALVAVDEATAIHEALAEPVIEATGASGVLHFAWLIPAFAALLVLAVLYLGWYRRLDPRVRLTLTLALGVYLLGAVVGEMVGGALYESGGVHTISYRLEAQLEELCESFGMILAAYALVEEIARRSGHIAIEFAGATQAAPRRRNRIGRELETRSPPA